MALFVHNNANRIQFLYIWCKIDCEKYVQKQTKIFSFPVLRLLVILSDFILKHDSVKLLKYSSILHLKRQKWCA